MTYPCPRPRAQLQQYRTLLRCAASPRRSSRPGGSIQALAASVSCARSAAKRKEEVGSDSQRCSSVYALEHTKLARPSTTMPSIS